MTILAGSGIFVWETTNSFDDKYISWSGYNASLACGLYADATNCYVLGQHAGFDDRQIRFITRLDVTTTTEDENTYHPEYNVGYTTTYQRLLMTHYIDDLGHALYSVSHEVPVSGAIGATASGSFFYTAYPESSASWIETTGEKIPVDLVFPDKLDNPRFLLGLYGNVTEKVMVVWAVSGLATRYPTNWTAMVSGSAVTDLEAPRIL